MEEKLKENKKLIKVCFFSPASYPFFEAASDAAHGGAELQMYLLAKFLSDNSKFKITFLVGNYGQKKYLNTYNIQLIRTIQLKQKEFFLIKLFKGIRYFFQLLKLKPDVLISTTANALVGINALYATVFKKKLIHRTASLIDVNYEYVLKNGLSGNFYKYGLKNADCVITQNDEHKKLLKQKFNIDAKVIKNVFEIEELNSVEKNYILWVSRFQTLKKPEIFLSLAKYFPKKKFIMICPYTPANKNAWNELRKKAELIPNLKFIEKVPYFEIQEYFNGAELFVNTSDYEGFPNTFLQAALGKTPIVSLNVNPDNFIIKYNCGIFAEGNFDKLLYETKNLLNDADQRILQGENLFRFVNKNHDINIIGKQLEKIINDLK